MDSFGVLGAVLQSMDSYLRGWSQTVVIDGVKSDPQDLQFGIPQGSALGPILFTIYTIPIGAIARSHNLEIHVYADDTHLYVFFKMKDPISQQKALCTLQSCIAEIRAWMVTNKLHLNDDKTEFLAICAPWLLRKCDSQQPDCWLITYCSFFCSEELGCHHEPGT